MKTYLELLLFEIKTKVWFCFLPWLFFGSVVLPFLINQAQYVAATQQEVYVYFIHLQKIIPLFLLYYLYFFFKDILDVKTSETLYAMNHKSRMLFLFVCIGFYQVIMIPIYMVAFFFFPLDVVIQETLCLLFICLFSGTLFYVLSQYFLSPMMAVGIVFGYIVIFIFFLPGVPIFNIFHVQVAITDIQPWYYLQYSIEWILLIYLGLRLERTCYL